MGVVWMAHDVLLNRDVAVKELVWPAYSSEAEQQEACRRATREAKLAARLNHRNVIRVFDIFEEDGAFACLRWAIDSRIRLSMAHRWGRARGAPLGGRHYQLNFSLRTSRPLPTQ